MKSKDLGKIVFLKRQDGAGPTKIFRDLSGELCLKTIKRWCKMIDQAGSINISAIQQAAHASCERCPSLRK